MPTSRRDLLAASGALAATVGLAGCNVLGGSDGESGDGTDGGTPSTGTCEGPSADVAVAAEWNAMRARVWDALALGVAGESGSGSAVAENVFARFEQASGEYGTHEKLEGTDERAYEKFEEALGELRSAGLDDGDLERAREEATVADEQLATAQKRLVGKPTTHVLDLQLLGARIENAGVLAAAGKFEAATTVAASVLERFENAAVHDALESADSEAYESFEAAVKNVESAAGNNDEKALRAEANAAFQAAIDGSYALATAENAAGAGHVAALQARGWDAAALAGMGGPSTGVAHAAVLTTYRARVYDAAWLAAKGDAARARTMVADVFAHFEGAKAHEALESASHDAYEGFEGGLSKLQTAIENGDTAAIESAVGTVDENLVAGIEKLTGSNAPVIEAAFFRARFADAYERYHQGEASTAASITQSLFERFEANELDVHETVESTSEDLYHRFEEKHLAGLVNAFEGKNDEAVETHYDGVQSTLLEFEANAGGTATVSAAEAAYVTGRSFDAAVVDALGNDERAAAIAQAAFEHFEGGAGGYHEALEKADHETYEAFEKALGAISTAATDGEDVYPKSKTFGTDAVASAYAVVGTGGGSHTEAAAGIAQGVFAHFEDARVHELLERADTSAYHGFEGALESFVSALQNGGDVEAAATSFASASLYAQFALVDGVEELPLDLSLGGSGGHGSGHGGGSGNGSSLQGGPNVVEGVPEDADHVVDMTAVAFEPGETTVSAGDTVAWKHTAGEAHTVTAYEGKIPDGADYWASGDFHSQSAATSGWEEGTGAVQAGQSFVHTFEATGTHEYFCIPHEAAGMTGTIVVE